MKQSAALINFGCGQYYHPDWVNCDIVSDVKSVIKVDVTEDLPFDSSRFDMVYSSHLLEHLCKSEANKFLIECHRILKPGGIIRLVVPDLERIAKLYLKYLTKLKKGDRKFEKRYNWMLLELFDQVSREKPGGEMLESLKDSNSLDKPFVIGRVGYEAENYWNKTSIKNSVLDRLVIFRKYLTFSNFQNALIWTLCRLLGGQKASQKYFVGLFRSMGEIHKNMYDSYSLKKLLEINGFNNVRICTSVESNLKNFYKYNLDAINGRPRKPDSLFMEAIK